MGKIINYDEASKFIGTIEDPIVQKLVRNSYQTLCLLESEPEGDFDLRFFVQVMESFLRDRDDLARSLRGEFDAYDAGWGD